MARWQDDGEEHRHGDPVLSGVGVFIWVFDAVAVLAVKTLVSLFAA